MKKSFYYVNCCSKRRRTWFKAFLSLSLLFLILPTFFAHAEQKNSPQPKSIQDSTFITAYNWVDRWQNETWMSQIKDNTRLSDLSIPGTHDSAAIIGATAGAASTQSLDIPHQLINGIRYLDVRAAVDSNGYFALYHGDYYENLYFGELLQYVYDFLDKNPGETIYLKLAQEHTSVSDAVFNKSFDYYVNLNPSRFYRAADSKTPNNPTLGETRGKIVVFKNFAGSDGKTGIQYPAHFNVQDDWDSPDFDYKRDEVLNQLKKAAEAGEDGKTYINYLSAWEFWTGVLGYASTNNFAATTYIATHFNISGYAPYHTGIVVADLPGDQLINRVIDTNYRYLKNPEREYDGASIVLRTQMNLDYAVWFDRAPSYLGQYATFEPYDTNNLQRFKMKYDPDYDAYTIVNENSKLAFTILDKDLNGKPTPTSNPTLYGVPILSSLKENQLWKVRVEGTSSLYGRTVYLESVAYPGKNLTIPDVDPSHGMTVTNANSAAAQWSIQID
jgi:1-phosphatidylinositol phosphodiesterase